MSLLVTASRVRGLPEFLDSKPNTDNSSWTKVQVTSECLPGAKLNMIKIHLAQIIPRLRSDAIIVAAGICNLTIKTTIGENDIQMYQIDKQER